MPRVALGRTPAYTCRYSKTTTHGSSPGRMGNRREAEQAAFEFFSACATHCRRLVVPAAFRMPILHLQDDLSFSLPLSLASLFHVSSELERGRWAKMPVTVARAMSRSLKVWKLAARASTPERERMGMSFRRVLVAPDAFLVEPRNARGVSRWIGSYWWWSVPKQRRDSSSVGAVTVLAQTGLRICHPAHHPPFPSCLSPSPGKEGYVPYPACVLHSGLFASHGSVQ
jgi:hypothetical protein